MMTAMSRHATEDEGKFSLRSSWRKLEFNQHKEK
jgi:hypothetical protein